MTNYQPTDPYETMTDQTIVPLESFGDFEVELDLIGSILKKGDVIKDIEGDINVDMIHSSVCRDIYQAIMRVKEFGLVIDMVTVGDQLERDGFLSTIQTDVFSGRAALSKIRDRGNPKNISSYVEIVKDYYAKRMLDEFAATAIKQSRNGRRATDIISDLRLKIDDLDMLGGKVSSKTFGSSQLMSILYDHVYSASNGDLKGCPTGFIDLDKLVTMMAGDLIIVGGRPGQGKSALLDSIATQVTNNYRKKVGIFSLEMKNKQVSARIISHMSGIPTDRILKGKMLEHEWPLFTQAVEKFENLPLSINDQAGITIPQMRAEARRMMRDMGGLDLIIVDYAQLMKPVRKYKNRNEDIGEITKGFKQIGGELDVPILAAAQMSRAVEQRTEKRPILSDLRESGDLENDADVVMFIYRPDQYENKTDKQNMTEIIVAKHRNGPVGSIELLFRGELAKFESVAFKNFSPNSPIGIDRLDIHGDD